MALLAIKQGADSPLFLVLASAAIVSFVLLLQLIFKKRVPVGAPPETKDNYPITGAWGFWTERWLWYQRQRDASPTGNFTFSAGPNTIVALSGDHGRQLFFESKELGFAEGYAVLFGSAPQVKEHDDGEGKEDDATNFFQKRLAYLLKNEQFRKKLPTLISDTNEAIERIQNDPNGVTDPFHSIYRIVFRLTIRMVGCNEIADDEVLLENTLRYFEMIDNSATAFSIMFPRLPSPAVLKRTYAGSRLYMMVENIIKKRAAIDEKYDDPLQYLLDQGDRTFKVVEFIVGALFAGLLNSGINAAWVMVRLACSPEWQSRTLEEIRTTAAKYARNPSGTLRDQLDDVPLEAWESEFPIVDLCLRDSIRLNLLGTAFRRNISGRAIPIPATNEVIPPGAFVTYATGDIHLDAATYKDPYDWDPSRYFPDRAEDKKNPIHGFFGWGSGRHPCTGMRFAKLEQNIITAYFLASFNFHLVNKNGKRVDIAPQMDFNGHSAHKLREPHFLKLSPREI